MVAIHFKHGHELNYIYHALSRRLLAGMKLNKKKRQLLIHIPAHRKEEGISLIKDVLKRYLLEQKRLEWWQSILAEDFYYRDQHEQNEIIQIAQSILQGKRKDLPVQIEEQDDIRKIETELSDVLNNNPDFSFDAFITFRLRFYLEKMGRLMEIAIDEYKLEQDYQMYLQYLRDYLQKRKPQMKQLHVVDDGHFLFFDEYLRRMSPEELEVMIDRNLLFSHPVYVDSKTIAPLLSIAPERIVLYTDRPSDPIVKTLKNIFEEKISIQPRTDFYLVKNE